MCCLVCDGLKAWPSWCLADLDSRQVSPLTDQHESGENPFKNTQQTSWPRENLKLVQSVFFFLFFFYYSRDSKATQLTLNIQKHEQVSQNLNITNNHKWETCCT